MCDSARCPQATHHPCHRPVWAEHAGQAKTFLGSLGPARKTEKARLQADYDRASASLAEIDAAATRTNRSTAVMRISADQRQQNESPDPGRHRPAPHRRHPARRQVRHQDPRPRGRRRPGRLLRHPALRPPPRGIRDPAPATAAGRRHHRPARGPDRPPQRRDHHAQAATAPTTSTTIAGLNGFKDQALARLAAQHDEIPRLRRQADQASRLRRLPARNPGTGPC